MHINIVAHAIMYNLKECAAGPKTIVKDGEVYISIPNPDNPVTRKKIKQNLRLLASNIVRFETDNKFK